MKKYLLALGSLLGLLMPATSFAAGKADLVNSIAGIYVNIGSEFVAVATNDELSSTRKFQTLSNASKARHDIAMNAIRNLK